VEPASQLTLPLAPTVTVHEAPGLQSMLHDSLHEPEHSAPSPQSSEQLPPVPHVVESKPHAVSAGQLHDAPLHSGGGRSSPPQAELPSANAITR
jgi:hypothetical protein